MSGKYRESDNTANVSYIDFKIRSERYNTIMTFCTHQPTSFNDQYNCCLQRASALQCSQKQVSTAFGFAIDVNSFLNLHHFKINKKSNASQRARLIASTQKLQHSSGTAVRGSRILLQKSGFDKLSRRKQRNFILVHQRNQPFPGQGITSDGDRI